MPNVESLASLAMLKVNADVQGRDYVDYFVPFVSYVLAHDSNTVTDARTQQLLRDEFGLRIPASAVGLVLRRLARRGYLRREHGVYCTVKPVPAPAIEPKRADTKRRIDFVLGKLSEFAAARHNATWTLQHATDAVVGYLSRFSIDFLRTYTRGSALPSVAPAQDPDLFIVNSFIDDALRSSPETFESVVVLVKGHMLTNALFCPDLGKIQKKFGDVTFYLDTPLIVQLLGLEGKPKCAAATELLTLLTQLDGTVALFSHTAEEISHVLKGTEDAMKSGLARGRIIQEAQRAGRTPSDFALMRARLDEFYRTHGIKRRSRPGYEVPFQIDERFLENAIDEYVSYANPRAVYYDIHSVRSVYVLRRGREPSSIEDCGAVLVTTNDAFAHAAFDYGKNRESTREVSSVITAFSLGNLAWLKAPLGSPELPRAEVIAACYAALEPKEALWAKYLAEIDKLKDLGTIGPRDHELLRYSLRARGELMNLTLGSEDAFFSETVPEILERVKSELVHEQVELLNAERSGHEATQEMLGVAVRRQELTNKRIHWLAARIGRVSGSTALVMLATLVVVFAALSAWYLPLVADSRWSTFVAVVIGIGAIVTVLNLVWGISVKMISQAVEAWAEKSSARLIARVLLSETKDA